MHTKLDSEVSTRLRGPFLRLVILNLSVTGSAASIVGSFQDIARNLYKAKREWLQQNFVSRQPGYKIR